MTRRELLGVASAAILAAAIPGSTTGAQAPFKRGGAPSGASPPTVSQACDGGSSVCAQFQNGQTFVTWTDPNSGAAGANDRFRVVRSTSPITSGNYGSATVIASYVFNNSGQLIGGDYTVGSSGESAYTQAYRQDASKPMVKLTSGGAALAFGTGLQVYTALGSAAAYYGVIQTNTSNTGDAYIGSVGPITESVAPPQPTKYADSMTRGQTFGKILGNTTTMPVMLDLHQSNASGGCYVISCKYGDYYGFFLTAAEEGYQDGRQQNFDVHQDSGNYRQATLVAQPRDVNWNPLGTAGQETWHRGLGLTPNPLVGPANRQYLSTANGYSRIMTYLGGVYGWDTNQIHAKGESMGAMASIHTGMRMTAPHLTAVWAQHPYWRFDTWPSSRWAGDGWLSSATPFIATVSPGYPSPLGTVATSVLLPDGTVWGGTCGYTDIPCLVSQNVGDDLPVAIWKITKDDYGSNQVWQDQLDALAELQTAGRGHAFAWHMGIHQTLYDAFGAIGCDWANYDTTGCYHLTDFKLNAPYPAIANSTFDDNPGTNTRDGNGIQDGDIVGCVNCGWKWSFTTDTSGALEFTLSNTWMNKSPTAIPQTTLAGSVASSGAISVALTSTAGFLAANGHGNEWFRIDNEIIGLAQLTGGNLVVSSGGRGTLGTTAAAHSAGAVVTQLVSQPTGPNGGPFSTGTADVTLRRLQGFVKSNGTTINCTVTPFGDSPVSKSGTVTGTHGVFTLTGVTINSGGSTGVSCS